MPASTVTEYLAALPADRRDALNEVRQGINPAYGGNHALTQLVTLCKVWT